ncbi:uncharacterized protein ISCGN_014684 [Ixodes scapularis]
MRDTSVKILGITIEENGKGDAWLRDTLKQCNSVLSMIRRICNARGGASQDIAKKMVKALVVSRVCYGARHYWLTARQWERLEALNNHAMRVITGLPRFTPLVKLRQYAQLNKLHDVVEARRNAHDERLKTTPQGRGIMRLLKKSVDGLPELQKQLPPWEDLAAITSSKPLRACRKGDTKQLARRVKAHNKMMESWKQSKTVVAAYTDTASLEGPVILKSAAVVFPALRLEAIEALPPTVSTKGGELAAIRLALETVVTQATDLPENLRIFTDSQEAVKECRSKNSPSVQVRKIKKLATTLRSRVSL